MPIVLRICRSIIHGRYDMICPLEQAFALHKVCGRMWIFKVIPACGHAASEPLIQQALVEATDALLEKLADWFDSASRTPRW